MLSGRVWGATGKPANLLSPQRQMGVDKCVQCVHQRCRFLHLGPLQSHLRPCCTHTCFFPSPASVYRRRRSSALGRSTRHPTAASTTTTARPRRASGRCPRSSSGTWPRRRARRGRQRRRPMQVRGDRGTQHVCSYCRFVVLQCWMPPFGLYTSLKASPHVSTGLRQMCDVLQVAVACCCIRRQPSSVVGKCGAAVAQ